MSSRHPRRLKHDPIVTALFEVRFMPTSDDADELLPGLLYEPLRADFERVERTPASDIPKVVRNQMPNGSYQATRRLVGNGVNLNIAERSLVVEVFRPYWGWNRFRSLIFRVLQAAKQTELVGVAERTSLRYQNILTRHGESSDISPLNLSIQLAHYPIGGDGFRLRTQIPAGEYITIVQIATGAQATLTIRGVPTKITGLLVDIDTIRPAPPRFWDNFEPTIEQLHTEEKNVFFNVLKNEAIEAMEPEW